MGNTVGLEWTAETENAVAALQTAEDTTVLVLSINSANESLEVASTHVVSDFNLANILPRSDPAYAFLCWAQENQKQFAFVYVCPTTSSIKSRMLYSCAVAFAVQRAKELGVPVSRRIESSDPAELTDAFVRDELNPKTGESDVQQTSHAESRPFARPKGPARKR